MVNERSERIAHSSFMLKLHQQVAEASKSSRNAGPFERSSYFLGGHFEKTGTHCVCRISGIAADPADEL